MHSSAIDDIACRRLHIGRVLHLPPLAVQSAVDTYRESGADGRTSSPSRPWTVSSGAARLSLVGTGGLVRQTNLDPYRRWFGSLRQLDRPAPSVPVEVEVTPWSTTACELGLRPSGRGVRLGDSRWRRRWFTFGLQVVEELARTIERTSWQEIVGALDSPTTTRIPA